eukprot:m.306797 g.306797  ORF g.306797 m.306797 type:complete len:91 (+) comp41593_c0_seq1:59-331(+)
MVYVSESGVLSQGPGWKANFFVDWFWSLVNFVVLFFHTMVNPKMTKKGQQYDSSDYRRPGQGPPRPPRKRMGGFRHGGGGASPPPMSGGG